MLTSEPLGNTKMVVVPVSPKVLSGFTAAAYHRQSIVFLVLTGLAFPPIGHLSGTPKFISAGLIGLFALLHFVSGQLGSRKERKEIVCDYTSVRWNASKQSNLWLVHPWNKKVVSSPSWATPESRTVKNDQTLLDPSMGSVRSWYI